MTTSTSKNLMQGLGASSSSVDADYLTLAVDSVQHIAHLVHSGVQLNERQCQDLCSKLVKTVENIRNLVPHSRACIEPFRSALKNLYRVLGKAKFLVDQCCNTNLCRAAVFQIHNEEAFREILLDVGLCYNVICELAKHIMQDWEWRLFQIEDLRQSSLFSFASENDVSQDQQTLERSLQHLVDTSDDPNQCLARYLLGKLQCLYEEHSMEDFGMLDALLWVTETEPQETWKLLRVLGTGSIGCYVCCYNWLDIPCARKEFDGQVADGIFWREAAILARLNHPNIVKFFCCSNGPEERQCFIAMELMEMSLGKLIENQRKVGQQFPIHVVLDIITQIARGICYLHGQNIAHRDLKPLNVVVTKLSDAHLEDIFCVKLVDFGMSKIKVQVSKSNTISIPGVGTTKYRAPEVFPQAQRIAAGGKKKVNWFQADAYSFAVTCTQLLSLKEPFEDVPRSALYDEIHRGQRPKLPEGCPNDLVVVLKECWSTNPQRRPSFEDICARLEKCKFQDLWKGSSISKFEILPRPLSYEFIERVLTKHAVVPSSCATTIPYDSDDTEDIILEEAYGVGQFAEELHPLDYEHTIVERKKKVGLWSRMKANFAQAVFEDVMGAILFRRKSNLQHVHEQKFKDFGVDPIIFRYNELRAATQDFHPDRRLGHDDLGVVYKGELPDQSLVTVTRLYKFFKHVQDEFFREVFCLSKLKHRNVVNLKGCCIHEEDLLLVYEFVDNSDVDWIILGSRNEIQVSWQTRLKIILGVARGLYYMHVLANPRFIHRDIKWKNVVVDRNWDPKIKGFGLAISFPDDESYIECDFPTGTIGYMAPECFTTMRLDDKVDVYSFGILCMEIISAERSFDINRPRGRLSLLDWAWRLHEEDRLLELADSTLKLTEEEVWDVQRVMKMSLLCSQEEPELRPSMGRVVSILQGDTEPEMHMLVVRNSSMTPYALQSSPVLSDEDGSM